MTSNNSFSDYYSVLHVNPSCDTEILESAYRHLAKTYHPDHSGADDTTKFDEVIKAYRVLRDPEQRAEYDVIHAQHCGRECSGFPSDRKSRVDEEDALSDADSHAKILMFLYEKRRENAQKAGVVAYYLQEMLKCSDELFDFHKWYLKEKGFVSVTEQGTLAITIQGVDHVISMSRTTRADKLLIAQSRNAQD